MMSYKPIATVRAYLRLSLEGAFAAKRDFSCLGYAALWFEIEVIQRKACLSARYGDNSRIEWLPLMLAIFVNI